MGKIKPVETSSKSGIIVGFIILFTAIIGTITKWKEFYDFFVPGGSLLNWRFVFISIVAAVILVWFIMNQFWKKEYEEHQKTRFDRDNYKSQLKLSENKRLTDVITGIPNSTSLEIDIQKFLKSDTPDNIQFILIDLKNFRLANKKYGFIKTNEVLRTIAQSIYNKMRRNEDMYKYPSDEVEKNVNTEGFYRVHSGGDEFAFIIRGDQSDALGFTNRLVGQFKALTEKTKDIFGEPFPLSFYCAIVEVDQSDSVKDILEKAGKCYRIAIEGKSPFTICWHPINIETTLINDEKKQFEYKKAREIFEVLTFIDKKYDQ